MDSMGNPWTGAYVTASGNLYADFMYNATAEMQGRLQVARLYNMTDDPGVKDLLPFLITRDHYHQQPWLAALENLKEDGLENVPVPEAAIDASWSLRASARARSADLRSVMSTLAPTHSRTEPSGFRTGMPRMLMSR